MIEINLLPGATRKTRGSGGFDLAALTGSLGSRIRDPYMLSAVGASVAAILLVGFMHVTHSAKAAEMEERYQAARADSVRYAAVIADRRSAEAQRDSVLRQIDIIRAIDDDRYIWAHIMEEVSRALPAYTWLTSVQQTSAVVTAAATVEAPAANTKGKAADDASAEVPDGPTRAPKFRIVGQTVDIQALTHFMKTLEASPFIQRVQLSRSDMALADGKQITEFHLDAEYEIPPREQLRTVPINLAVR
jgi:Tfp pilus assembly protein PilN